MSKANKSTPHPGPLPDRGGEGDRPGGGGGVKGQRAEGGVRHPLLAQCAASDIWNDLFFDGKMRELSDAQLELVVFAGLVAAWTWEVEKVIKDLKVGKENAACPIWQWSFKTWLAFYDGRLSAVDDQIIEQHAHVSAEELGHTPGMARLLLLREEAWTLLGKLTGRELGVAA